MNRNSIQVLEIIMSLHWLLQVREEQVPICLLTALSWECRSVNGQQQQEGFEVALG